jgi:hypothetical protein
MRVLINDLANVPHNDGQIVLDVRRDDFAVKVEHDRDCYRVYGFVRLQGGGEYTRLAAERPTVQAARDLARRVWREGRNFDTVYGAERVVHGQAWCWWPR